MTEEDKSVFLSAVSDVTPIRSAKQVNEYSQRQTQARIKSTLKKVRKSQFEVDIPKCAERSERTNRPNKVGPFEKIMYHQKGIQLQTLSRLRKGELRAEGVLDLHGLTIENAEPQILSFVNEALQNKKRVIRIIHGKGYNSDEPFPALKNLVNQTLRSIIPIIAFCSAPEKEGGTGAVNVLLKAQRA